MCHLIPTLSLTLSNLIIHIRSNLLRNKCLTNSNNMAKH